MSNHLSLQTNYGRTPAQKSCCITRPETHPSVEIRSRVDIRSWVHGTAINVIAHSYPMQRLVSDNGLIVSHDNESSSTRDEISSECVDAFLFGKPFKSPLRHVGVECIHVCRDGWFKAVYVVLGIVGRVIKVEIGRHSNDSIFVRTHCREYS